MTAIVKSKTCLGELSRLQNGEVIRIHFTKTKFELPDLIHHYAELGAFINNRPSKFIYSFESIWITPLSHEARVYNNAMLEQYTTALTAVAESPMLRSFVNFYIRIAQFPFPAKVFRSVEDCETYLLGRNKDDAVTAKVKSA